MAPLQSRRFKNPPLLCAVPAPYFLPQWKEFVALKSTFPHTMLLGETADPLLRVSIFSCRAAFLFFAIRFSPRDWRRVALIGGYVYSLTQVPFLQKSPSRGPQLFFPSDVRTFLSLPPSFFFLTSLGKKLLSSLLAPFHCQTPSSGGVPFSKMVKDYLLPPHQSW